MTGFCRPLSFTFHPFSTCSPQSSTLNSLEFSESSHLIHVCSPTLLLLPLTLPQSVQTTTSLPSKLMSEVTLPSKPCLTPSPVEVTCFPHMASGFLACHKAYHPVLPSLVCRVRSSKPGVCKLSLAMESFI